MGANGSWDVFGNIGRIARACTSVQRLVNIFMALATFFSLRAGVNPFDPTYNRHDLKIAVLYYTLLAAFRKA